MALAVKRSASAGGADATIASAANWFTQLTGVLVAAGWTAHDTLSATDIVYTSPGENGHRAAFFRIIANSNTDWQTLNYQYWDAATHVGYNGVTPTAFKRTSFTAGTYQHVFVADLDGFSWSMWQGSSGYFGGGGWFDPPAGTSMEAVATTAALAPGDLVEVKVAADPATRGIEMNQTVTVMAQEAATPPIALFCTTVTGTRFDGSDYYVTLRKVPASLAAGALIGQAPHHIYNLGIRDMGSGFAASFVTTGFIPGMPNQDLNMYSAIGGTPSNGYTAYTDTSMVSQAGSGIQNETDPDGRTGRVYIDPLHIKHTLVGKSAHMGSLSKLYRIAKNNDAQWFLYRTVKAATPRDWAVSIYSATRFVNGPIPTNGSVTNLAELFPSEGVVAVYANDHTVDACDSSDQPVDSDPVWASVFTMDSMDLVAVFAAPSAERTQALRALQHTPTVAGEIAVEPFANNQIGYTMLSANPISDKVVRLVFSAPLRHVDPSAINDGLNPINYLITGGRTPVSVAFVSEVDGISTFDVTVDLEWVIGTTYTIRVKSAMTPGDLPPDAFFNHDLQTFIGAATRPTISTASAGERRVDVTLSEPMKLDTLVAAAFTVAPNGGSGVAVSVTALQVVNSSQMRLTLNKRMTNGQPYRVTMLPAAQDAVGNAAAAATTFDFTGFAAPAATLAIAFLDATHIRVTFDVDVTNDSELQDPASYQGSNGLQILAVLVESARSVVLTTSEMQHGISYTLTTV